MGRRDGVGLGFELEQPASGHLACVGKPLVRARNPVGGMVRALGVGWRSGDCAVSGVSVVLACALVRRRAQGGKF